LGWDVKGTLLIAKYVEQGVNTTNAQGGGSAAVQQQGPESRHQTVVSEQFTRNFFTYLESHSSCSIILEF
jgi:hypothetical protein